MRDITPFELLHGAFKIFPASHSKADMVQANPSVNNSEFSGSVIFACCDDAIEFVTEHEDELKKKYILETQDLGVKFPGSLLVCDC